MTRRRLYGFLRVPIWNVRSLFIFTSRLLQMDRKTKIKRWKRLLSFRVKVLASRRHRRYDLLVKRLVCPKIGVPGKLCIRLLCFSPWDYRFHEFVFALPFSNFCSLYSSVLFLLFFISFLRRYHIFLRYECVLRGQKLYETQYLHSEVLSVSRRISVNLNFKTVYILYERYYEIFYSFYNCFFFLLTEKPISL